MKSALGIRPKATHVEFVHNWVARDTGFFSPGGETQSPWIKQFRPVPDLIPVILRKQGKRNKVRKIGQTPSSSNARSDGI
jgi:hypothetical protein